MIGHPTHLFTPLGAAISVPKCAKSTVLPKTYMSSNDTAYLPGLGPAIETKSNTALLIVGGAIVAGIVVFLWV